MASLVIEKEQVHSLDVVRELLPFRQQLSAMFGTGHGNANLELIDVLIVMLAGFFNPLVRSQRLLEALSTQNWMKDLTGLERIAKSTLGDALARFDPHQLRPLIAQLAKRVPALQKRDADLATITREIVAADGSYFQTAADVAWAILSGRKASQSRNQVRLNMQLVVNSFTPLDCDISGRYDASEPHAFKRRLHCGVIYVADRNFYSFEFINEVLRCGSNLVPRVRSNAKFNPVESLPLSAKDAEAEILSDELGHFTGAESEGNEDHRSFTAKPPTQRLRRIIIWDQANKKKVVLITDLLDLPAYIIAAIYRQRWEVELFFKWLKCYAGFDHLMSHHPNGVNFQFYVAVIATLLMHLATGRRVSKYTLFWLDSIIRGQATFAQMQADLTRIERQKEFERARRKKAAERKKLGN